MLGIIFLNVPHRFREKQTNINMCMKRYSRPPIRAWVKNRYPKSSPCKWKHGLKPAVPWWLNLDPYPYIARKPKSLEPEDLAGPAPGYDSAPAGPRCPPRREAGSASLCRPTWWPMSPRRWSSSLPLQLPSWGVGLGCFKSPQPIQTNKRAQLEFH